MAVTAILIYTPIRRGIRVMVKMEHFSTRYWVIGYGNNHNHMGNRLS